MDILTINNRQVLKCVHCNGTGLCTHADFQKTRMLFERGRDIKVAAWVLFCGTCGEGLPREDQGGIGWVQPKRSEMKPPTCRVCEGKGFNVIG